MVNVQSYLSMMWTDKATIYEYERTTDPLTRESVRNLVPVRSNVPCRISFENSPTTAINLEVANVSQTIKLFLDVSVPVSAGSVISVTRNGVTEKYRRSGVPARYNSHQEIVLEKYEDFA